LLLWRAGAGRSDELTDRADSGGNEEGGGENGTDDRDCELLQRSKIESHCLCSFCAAGPSGCDANSFAEGMPNAKNGRFSPFSFAGRLAAGDRAHKIWEISPFFRERFRTLPSAFGQRKVKPALTIFLGNSLTLGGVSLSDSNRGPMSRLSFTLSKALARGRRGGGRPGSREEVLARLLMKRAAARRAGLEDLEAQLREQIVWSLPVQKPADDARVEPIAGDGPDEDALDDRL
jgi:hypothetical protein